MPDNTVLGKVELTTLTRDDRIYVIRVDEDDVESDHFAKLEAVEKLLENDRSQVANGSGAVPLDKDQILISNISLSTINLTLADGTEGQEILFVSQTMTSNVNLTPTNFISNSVTFTLSGQSLKLKFIGSDWYVISLYGATVN